MKRVNSVRQIKKRLRQPFHRMIPFTVTTYSDTFYHVKKNMFIDHAESYYEWNDFKSRSINITFKRKLSISDSEDYKLFIHK